MLSSIILGVSASSGLSAQTGIFDTRPQNDAAERLLTMEEAVIGNELRPENRSTIWRPGTSDLSVFENGRLLAMNPAEGTDCEILSSEDLIRLTGAENPEFETWTDMDHVVFRTGKTYFMPKITPAITPICKIILFIFI